MQEWSYFRGGLSTIDRDYGIFNKIHHDIGTHVVHHLFPQMPHYNLTEATEVRPSSPGQCLPCVWCIVSQIPVTSLPLPTRVCYQCMASETWILVIRPKVIDRGS